MYELEQEKSGQETLQRQAATHTELPSALFSIPQTLNTQSLCFPLSFGC